MDDFKRFIDDLKFSGKAENTIETYQLQLKRYLDFLDKLGIDHKDVRATR